MWKRCWNAESFPIWRKFEPVGSYTRLKTTYPAQTPVAWSSFVTGTNPGGHGIFDFICRDPQTYLARCCIDPLRAPEKHAGATARGKPARRRAAVADRSRQREFPARLALSVYFSSGSFAGQDAGGRRRSRPARQPEQRHVLYPGQIRPLPRKTSNWFFWIQSPGRIGD